MNKASWRLLVKESGWVAAEKQGVGIGFKLVGWGYLNKVTKNYVPKGTADYSNPTVDDSSISWQIFNNVTLKLTATPDSLHEGIEVPQIVRDHITTNNPYGVNGYVVYAYEVRWDDVSEIEDEEQGPQNPDTNWESEARVFLKNAAGKIVSALPAHFVKHATLDSKEAPPIRIRRRFIKKDDKHYLLFGVPVDALANMPSGTVVFDPTVDKQVTAGGDDGYYRDGDGSFSAAGDNVLVGHWDSHASYKNMSGFFRWIGVTIEGTVTTMTVEVYVYVIGGGETNLKFYGIDEDNPAAPTDAAEFLADPETTAGVDWDVTFNTSAWNTSPELKTIAQELVDTYTISNAAVMLQLQNDGTTGDNDATIRAQDFDDNTKGAKLSITYTVAAPTVTTQAADQIGPTSARGNGNITDDGGSSIIEHGVCWKKGADPVNIGGADGYTEEGAGSEGAFTSNMTLLDPESTYYYRAYATNPGGTSYGDAQSFKTMISAAASGQAASEGSAAGLLALQGGASGQGISSGKAAGLLALIGTGEGQATSSGVAGGLLALIGDAAGQATSSGDVAGQIGHPASASGQATSSGVASALLSLIGQAEGQAASEGTVYALLALIGGAEGQGISSGEVAGHIGYVVSATGIATSQGAAAALLELMAKASGLAVTTWDIIIYNFTGELAPGETLVIDHKAKTVTIDGVNVLKYFTTGDFPDLPPGSSTVKYGDLEDSRDLTITVTYKDKWL